MKMVVLKLNVEHSTNVSSWNETDDEWTTGTQTLETGTILPSR